MREYLLISRGDTKAWEKQTPEEWQELMHRFEAWIVPLKVAGLFQRGDRIPGQSKVLQREGHGVLISDGPFVETKEALTGFFLIRARDLNHALEIAQGCPTLLKDTLQVFELYAQEGEE